MAEVEVNRIVASLAFESQGFARGIDASTRKWAEAASRIGSTGQRAGGFIERTFKGIGDQIGAAQRRLVSFQGVFAGVGAGLGVREIVNAKIELQSLRAQLKAATGSAQDAADAEAFLREEGDRLGQSFLTLARGYVQLAASTRGTTIEGAKTAQVFSDVSEAITVLGLSQERADFVFRALSQMASGPTIRMEELNVQLRDHLPGAVQKAAQAWSQFIGKEIDPQQFRKVVEEGKVLTEDFLPAFARVLKESVAEGLPDAVNSGRAALARLATDFFDLKNDLADAGVFDSVIRGVERLRTSIRDPFNVKIATDVTQDVVAITESLVRALAGLIAEWSRLPRPVQEFGLVAAALFGLKGLAVMGAGLIAIRETREALELLRGALAGVIPLSDFLLPGLANEDELERLRAAGNEYQQLAETMSVAPTGAQEWADTFSKIGQSLAALASTTTVEALVTEDAMRELRARIEAIWSAPIKAPRIEAPNIPGAMSTEGGPISVGEPFSFGTEIEDAAASAAKVPEAVLKAQEELRRAVAAFGTLEIAFPDFDRLEAEAEAVTQALMKMLGEGVDPLSPAVQTLALRSLALQRALADRTGAEEFRDWIADVNRDVIEMDKRTSEALDDLQRNLERSIEDANATDLTPAQQAMRDWRRAIDDSIRGLEMVGPAADEARRKLEPFVQAAGKAAEDAAARVSVDIGDAISGALGTIFEGALSGTRDLKPLEVFRDAAIGVLGEIFTDTIKAKKLFDHKLETNLLGDALGTIKKFARIGADALGSLFGVVPQKSVEDIRAEVEAQVGAAVGTVKIPAPEPPTVPPIPQPEIPGAGTLPPPDTSPIRELLDAIVRDAQLAFAAVRDVVIDFSSAAYEAATKFFGAALDQLQNFAVEGVRLVVEFVKSALAALQAADAGEASSGFLSFLGSLGSLFGGAGAGAGAGAGGAASPAYSPTAAEGGIFTRPTLTWIGEGGEPEYVIPQSKMAETVSEAAAEILSRIPWVKALEESAAQLKGPLAEIDAAVAGPPIAEAIDVGRAPMARAIGSAVTAVVPTERPPRIEAPPANARYGPPPEALPGALPEPLRALPGDLPAALQAPPVGGAPGPPGAPGTPAPGALPGALPETLRALPGALPRALPGAPPGAPPGPLLGLPGALPGAPPAGAPPPRLPGALPTSLSAPVRLAAPERTPKLPGLPGEAGAAGMAGPLARGSTASPSRLRVGGADFFEPPELRAEPMIAALEELLASLSAPMHDVDTALETTSPGIDRLVGLERGGIVTGPTIAALAERGRPEAVLPLDHLGDFLGGAGGGRMQVFVENNVPGVQASAREETGPNGQQILRLLLSRGFTEDLGGGGPASRMLEQDYGVHRQPGLR